jgi:hypothetical protein
MRYVVIVTGWVWGLFALEWVSSADDDPPIIAALLFYAAVIGLVWLLYSLCVPGVFLTSRVRWLWLSIPIIGLGMLFLGRTDVPLTARVWLCDAELREYAESARRDPQLARAHGRVGLFRVAGTAADEKQVLLFTGSGFLALTGIAYRPDGAPPEYRDGLRRLGPSRHLYGPWWWFLVFDD